MAVIKRSGLVRLMLASLLVVGFAAGTRAYENRFERCDVPCPEYGCSIGIDCPSGCTPRYGECKIDFDVQACGAFFECDCQDCYFYDN